MSVDKMFNLQETKLKSQKISLWNFPKKKLFLLDNMSPQCLSCHFEADSSRLDCQIDAKLHERSSRSRVIS